MGVTLLFLILVGIIPKLEMKRIPLVHEHVYAYVIVATCM